jgi:hypothetical protein
METERVQYEKQLQAVREQHHTLSEQVQLQQERCTQLKKEMVSAGKIKVMGVFI